MHAFYNIAVSVDTFSVSRVAALVFAGSLEELTRIGVMAWLHDERYEKDAKANLKSWGQTLWTMWKIYHKGSHSGPWMTRVPKEVLDMDCWKAVPRKGPAPGGRPLN
jgi:hypothetical protein